MANKRDPRMMKFLDKDIASFQNRKNFSLLRIDQDEKDHSFFLLKGKEAFPIGKHVDHIERIHVDNNVADIRFIHRIFRLPSFYPKQQNGILGAQVMRKDLL